ncbi:hypothetical protein [Microbispora sp. ATCC PTA-5024]|uniref:hypothetical protein n=1 Tax=Microbispora sp. ATCC PTA-5024 TaxID=316330 RepID=UPI0003DCB8E1|nr:hypothetical protein [Microbispora sp. ATCC PTA-5024]ETK35222.1 hypothetical protein MPTA5024_15285 [Microbispora sp. ATCC PTA-5024]
MTDDEPAIRRLCVAAAGCARGDLDAILADLCRSAGLERLLWNDPSAEPRVGVLPPGFDEPRLVGDIITRTLAAVRRRRRRGGDVAVRLALHEGLTVMAGGQFGGPGVNAVRALCGVGAYPVPLAVVISGRLFDDVAALGGDEPALRRFRPAGPGSWLALFGEG